MDALSITVYANKRPVLTRQVSSVRVIEGGLQEARPVDKGREATPTDKAQLVERGTGVGTAAQQALVQSNAEDRSADGLTPEEQDLVVKLAARDREVRQHEEAHARVGGQYAGQPSYSYQTGPDGKRYAIGGQVPIDVAPVPDDPKATIDKMDIVKQAALAPAEPSAADRRVAALADAQRLQAVADLNTQKAEERGQIFQGDGLAEAAKRLARGMETEPGQIFSRAA